MKMFFKKITVALLTLEATAVLRKYQPRIVAITGSVGKTAAKDAIYALLARSHFVRRSEKSFNSEIGIPLTILGLPNAWDNPLHWLLNLLDGFLRALVKTRYPSWLVLEVGADRPGDIRRAADLLRIDVVVITRLPEVPVHVEFFASPAAVVEEKLTLIEALKPEGALVAYEDTAPAVRERFPQTTLVTFGFSPHCDVYVERVELLTEEGSMPEAGWPIGMRAYIHAGGVSAPVSVVGAVGSHALLPLCAAAAVGHALGTNLGEIIEALKVYEPPRGRMRLLRGVKRTLVIDDTYNSSPAALAAALDVFAMLAPRGRRIAVLGDMMELGRYSIAEHRRAGELAARACDLLLTVGPRARDIAGGALDAGMTKNAILQYDDARRAGDELDGMLQEGDVVLVKGSQSMRMERVVEEVIAEPERAGELLVRQEIEWKKR